MSPIANKKFRFSDAVYVMDTTPKSLRKWLQHPEMLLHFSGQEKGWFDFNFVDLCVLVVMRKMVDFGLSIGEATAFANTAVMSHAMVLFHETPNCSPQVLVEAFDGVRCLIWRDNGSDDPWMSRIDGFDRNGVLVKRPPPAPAYLTIEMHSVLSTALERAIEILGDAEFPVIQHGAPAPILSVDGVPTRHVKDGVEKKAGAKLAKR